VDAQSFKTYQTTTPFQLSFHYYNNLKFFIRQQLPSIEELYFESCGLFMFFLSYRLFIRDCRMLNLSLNNENPIQKLRMKHLYLVDLPRVLIFPGWNLCVVDTLETLEINDTLQTKKMNGIQKFCL
jgi:hypothetical protein